MSPEERANLSSEEQIARLVRQRNAMWRLLDDLSLLVPEELDLEDLVDFEVDTGDSTIVCDLTNLLSRIRTMEQALVDAFDKTRTILGDYYLVEGVNPSTGDEEPTAGAIYRNEKGEPWL
jgi:hypothetical protein